ncbi:MAG: PEGA domain-containing protein [Prevotella sp.]|nr:PEGA domain-containing protein [Prevotella sp.]
MFRKATLIIWMLVTMLPLAAQNMSIVGFGKQKKSLIKDIKVPRDREMATFILTTDEKGFTFKANGTTEVKAEEGEGMLTLKVPHKTQYLTVTHPDYGQITWRVPSGSLRKKRIYQAYLQTYDPSKEYKKEKQWVVFKVSPEAAVIYVDSVMARTMNGEAQFYVAVDKKHPYKVISPFYQEVEDTLEVHAEQKLILPVNLQPKYSYLRVKAPIAACRILVDNQEIGYQEAMSGHLAEGTHRLTIFIGTYCCYDAPIAIGAAEKKTVVLTHADLIPRPWKEQARVISPKVPTDTTKAQKADAVNTTTTAVKAPVTIIAPDDETEIVINTETVGHGRWEGKLPEGFYIVNTKKNGEESLVRYLWVENDFPQEMKIGSPQIDKGLLNVHSNVTGAQVYVNDSLKGSTPCIIENLPAGKTFTVRLEMPEYKKVERKVLVLGNDMVDVELIMKKKRRYDHQ